MSRFFLFARLAKGKGLKGRQGHEGRKREFCTFSCELPLFLGGGCALNDVFCGFKTQRAIHVYGVPLPKTKFIGQRFAILSSSSTIERKSQGWLDNSSNFCNISRVASGEGISNSSIIICFLQIYKLNARFGNDAGLFCICLEWLYH